MQILLTIQDCETSRMGKLVKKDFHLVFTDSCVYFISAKEDFSPLVEASIKILGGLGGLVSEVVSDLAGPKIGQLFQNITLASPSKRLEKVLANIDAYVEQGRGVYKIPFSKLQSFTYKLPHIADKTYRVRFKSEQLNMTFRVHNEEEIDKIIWIVERFSFETKVQKAYLYV